MRRLRAVALLLVAGATAWLVTGLGPFTTAATVAVLVTGALGVAAGALMRRPDRRPVKAAGVLVWAALAGAIGTWEGVAYLQLPRREHPTISSLAEGVLEAHWARAAAFVLWLVVAVAIGRR